MSKLSVLVCSPDPSIQGGVSVFIELMKTHLKNCDVTPVWVGAHPEHKENPVAMVKRLLLTPIAISRMVRSQHFDVVHINPSLTWRSCLRDGLILLALRFAGVKRVLVYFHGWDVPVEQCLKRTPGLCGFSRWLLNGTQQIMVLSPEFKKGFEDMGIKRVVYTRTMFDGAALDAAVVASPPRRKILFMSRFIPEKGVYELVEAFARMKEHFPDVDLVMAGDGPERKGLQERVAALDIKERVSFPGYVEGAEKYALLRECVIYTLPTYLGEGMPVALLEAMGAGKPLLTAKAGAIQYIVSDPENGVVLDRVTVARIEDGLRRLLKDEVYCYETGARNKAYAWERFEAQKVTAEIETLYHEIAVA